MFERFNEAARRALFFARYEAGQLGTMTIEPEHILLGLIRESGPFLTRLAGIGGTAFEEIRSEVRREAGTAKPLGWAIEIPFNGATQRIFHFAVEEADGLGHPHIGPEHLLLGILREPGAGDRLRLGDHGVQLEAVRKAAGARSPEGGETVDPSDMSLASKADVSRTIYYTATSLDGFIADPQNSLDWLFQFGEPGPGYQTFIAGVGALAMGSTTYEWVVNHLAKGKTPEEQAWPYQQPAWVFTSRALKTIHGADIRFVRGDVGTVHQQMLEAADGKNVWLVGGGELVGQFHDQGLLDELVVQIAAVTLGSGAPLLPRAIVHPPLRLLSVERMGDAFVELRYGVERPAPAVAATA